MGLYPFLPFLWLIIGGTAIVLLHRLYFVVLPKRAILKYRKSDPARLRRFLSQVVNTPTLLGPAQKLVARSFLMKLAMAEEQYSEAAAHARAILDHLPRSPHVTGYTVNEAMIRHRLADCLEALGQPDGATTERKLAAVLIDRAPDRQSQRLTKGRILKRERRYDEARAAFEEAVEMTTGSNLLIKVECLLELAEVCYQLGLMVESLRWAEAAIALNPRRWNAHRMAAVICGNLGRLDESEGHFRRAHDAANSQKNAAGVALILASFADIQRRRGELAGAFEACRKVADIEPNSARYPRSVEAGILYSWGRFDEALAMLDQVDETEKPKIPTEQRRIEAVRLLERSKIEAEAGHVDDAWTHIQAASVDLADDAKLGLRCDAVVSWVFALRGLAKDSRRVADQVEARLSDFEQDPSTQRGALYDLGMAALARGDFDVGLDCWNRYLVLSPDPVYQPTAHYIRGECRRLLSDLEGANADYRQAVAMKIDSHHARLAGARLKDLESGQSL